MNSIDKILTEAAVLELSQSLEDSVRADEFFGRVDVVLSEKSNFLNLDFSIEFPFPLTVRKNGSSVLEIDNIKSVFDGISEIGRDRASDPRLWNYLSFVTFRSYMNERWPPNQSDSWKKSTKSRWLLINPSRNTLMRHGIARLWWIAQLTVDHDLPDHYGYTEVVAEKEDRIQAVLDRQIGSIPNVCKAVLDYASISPAHGHEERIRYVMKCLTAIYGYRDLARLSKDAIAGILQEIEAAKPAYVR